MSGIVGIYHRDGRPSDFETLRTIAHGARHRGPDAERFWVEGAVGIGHQWLRVWSHESVGRQWVVDATRRLVVTLDGRLDNGPELVSACQQHLRTSRPHDADLVLAAYLQWGEDCAARLLGDFALAIWDGARQRVYCARDVSGIKPFLYALDATRFVWASDLRQILAAGIDREPNEGMVGEHLAGAMTSRSETLYRNVMRLPPAHWMTVTPDRVSLRRYWSADSAPDITYRTDDEYAEHFLSIFHESIACRVESREVVGAYLSGGLDSSSVVGVACSRGRAVETFSLVFPDTPEADERMYIDDVVGMWGLTAHRIDAGVIDGAAAAARATRRADVMDMPSDLLGERMLERVRARGIRVVLTGAGGDYGLSGSFFHYADLLRSGDWRGLVRQMRADRRMDDVNYSCDVLFAYGIRPLIPTALRAAVRPAARHLGLLGGVPDWIGREFLDRTALLDRLRAAPTGSSPSAGSYCRRDVCATLESGWVTWFLETKERSAAEYLVEERHPFFDRRLVEFTIGIPEQQRWRGEQTKVVLRRALRDKLPDSVYARTDKGDFSSCVVDAIEQVGGQPGGTGAGRPCRIEALHTASLGWVDQARVSTMYRDLRRWAQARDLRYCQVMFPLWHVLGIEQWYRDGFLKGQRDEPEGSPRTSHAGPGATASGPGALRAAGAR